jgi:hypothetical protein
MHYSNIDLRFHGVDKKKHSALPEGRAYAYSARTEAIWTVNAS